MNNIKEEIKEKIDILNRAAKAYYQEDREIMPNIEYDRLYDELLELEQQTGIVFSNSPSINVGYELLSNLPKERHENPILSLDKTKDLTVLADWLGLKRGVLSWKLDGLTIVLTYKGGILTKAVTRGNGEIGEVITNNAKVFANLPLKISYQGDLILRGEAIIRYSDFERINSEIDDVDAKYKNPRNLCSGSVRQLNNKITKERNVFFLAFAVMQAEDVDFQNSRLFQLEWLKTQGFDVVDYQKTTADELGAVVATFAEKIPTNDFPSDGLVLMYDDISYGESLGATSKFPRDAIAFKWKDEIKETELIEIEWSASRTGLINPIAVFEPVELEGTTVSRASVHNVSVLEKLELGIGDKICVYKANMIIPQISKNLTKSGMASVPRQCPVCEGETLIKQENGVKFLYCTNPDCLAKNIKKLSHFVSRDAMNIDGLSEATIEKLIAKGFVHEYADLFHVEKFKEEIVEMEGFGEKSFQNLVHSVNQARNTNAVRLLYSLGIPNIGLSNAKAIARQFAYDWETIAAASLEQLTAINGVGEIMAEAYVRFFENANNKKIIEDILQEVRFEVQIESRKENAIFEGINFVITGSLEHYENRNELKALIEEYGGKTTDSVTSKTNYLINNDNLSNSTKNKKAKEIGVAIITEGQLTEWIETGAQPSIRK
ncbi:MAG: NAD-dependent DNA ligase LigA [Eubacteriales bacterium]|nr:NAD-dependent DNA ligase LigA [Eubacteriales bacterium]MDD3349678.1 NAD-dependent DNA ligase LigA [Eubacteriales bacterium]